MDEGKKVLFPDELIEDKVIETTIFPVNSKTVGIAVLSHKEGPAHILRIYQLLYNKESESYEPIQELAAFTFKRRDELTDFLDDLPHLNGLEMLMLLNPIGPNQEYLN